MSKIQKPVNLLQGDEDIHEGFVEQSWRADIPPERQLVEVEGGGAPSLGENKHIRVASPVVIVVMVL